jgi:hypothetical protein
MLEWEDKFAQIRNHLHSFDSSNSEVIYLWQIYNEESKGLKRNRDKFYSFIKNYSSLNDFYLIQENIPELENI